MIIHKKAGSSKTDKPVLDRKYDMPLPARMLLMIEIMAMSAMSMDIIPLPVLPHNCVDNTTNAKFSAMMRPFETVVLIMFLKNMFINFQ